MAKIEYETFNKLKDRMKAKFPVLLEGFLRDANNYLVTIDAGLSGDDLAPAIDAAHSLKSASGLLGLTEVHKAAETLEYQAKEKQDAGQHGADDQLRASSAALRAAFADVEDDLQDELAKAKAV